jgi:hypothetical protein
MFSGTGMTVVIAEQVILAKAMIIRIRICDDGIQFSQTRPRQSAFHRQRGDSQSDSAIPPQPKFRRKMASNRSILIPSVSPPSGICKPKCELRESANSLRQYSTTKTSKDLLTEISAVDYTSIELDVSSESFRYFFDATASVYPLHSYPPESTNTHRYSQPFGLRIHLSHQKSQQGVLTCLCRQLMPLIILPGFTETRPLCTSPISVYLSDMPT